MVAKSSIRKGKFVLFFLLAYATSKKKKWATSRVVLNFLSKPGFHKTKSIKIPHARFSKIKGLISGLFPSYREYDNVWSLSLTIIMISCSVTDCGQMNLLPRDSEYSPASLNCNGCFVLVLQSFVGLTLLCTGLKLCCYELNITV